MALVWLQENSVPLIGMRDKSCTNMDGDPRLGNPVVAGASWVLVFLAPLQMLAMAAAGLSFELCALQIIPNPGAPAHSGLFRACLGLTADTGWTILMNAGWFSLGGLLFETKELQ